MALCFFDLDGTLLNTLEDLAVSMNLALENQGFKSIPAPDYRYLLGKGVRNLAEQVLDRQVSGRLAETERSARLSLLLEDFRRHYEKHFAVQTRPYLGVAELLKKLNAEGIAFGVLSNKSDALSRAIIAHFFPASDYRFAFVHGLSEQWPRKPDPGLALALAAAQGATPRHCYFIGDSSTDMRTARNAAFNAIGVSWGFRDEKELWDSGADYVVSKADELGRLLSRLSAAESAEGLG